MYKFNFNSYDTSNQTISYCEVDKCKAVVELKQQLDQLKAYNKQLEKENLHYRNLFAMQYMSIAVDGKEVYCGPVKKLEKTLTEIKKIAKEYQKNYLINNGVALLCNQILQKINECEVTNDMENN